MFFTREAPTLDNPQHHFSKQFLAALLAEPCVKFLPINEITAARLPALLGLAFYLWGVWRLKKNFEPGWQQVLVVAALVGNAFLLDFFSVARGYGLAMGCTALSLSFLMHADTVPGQAKYVLWWAAMAMLSCLSFLYFYLAICAVLWWMKWRKAPGLTTFGWVGSAVFSLVMLAVFCLPRILYSLRSSYILEQGGPVVRNGFFGETLLSLLNCFLYGMWWASGQTPSAVLTPWSAITLIACGWTIVGLVIGLGICSWGCKEHTSQMLVGIMIIVFALLELAHGIGNVQFLRERTALFLLPVFVLLIDTIAAQSRSRWLWGLLVIMAVAGMAGYSPRYTYTWRGSADMRSVLLDLREIHNKTGQGVQIAFSDGSKWSAWYYAERSLGLHLAPATAGGGDLREYEWLTLYEWKGCRILLVDPSHSWLLPGTTHLLLDDDDIRLLSQFTTGKVAELKFYPASGMRLFALTAPEFQGAVRYLNGTVYVGGFRDAEPNGSGTLTFPNGNKYVGTFVNGHPDGQGALTLPNEYTYVGQFSMGRPVGQGTLMYPDGRQCVGEFEDGTMRVFRGSTSWPDGRKYVGQFRYGKMDGTGKMIYPDGKVEEGLWKDGKFVGVDR